MNMTRKENQKGFTLVELLVAVAIMAILMGLIVGLSGVARRKSTEAKAQAEVQAIATALEEYRMSYGFYPPMGSNALAVLTNQNTSIPTELKAIISLKDPWSRDYKYENVTKYSYTLYSEGASTNIPDDNITTGTVQ